MSIAYDSIWPVVPHFIPQKVAHRKGLRKSLIMHDLWVVHYKVYQSFRRHHICILDIKILRFRRLWKNIFTWKVKKVLRMTCCAPPHPTLLLWMVFLFLWTKHQGRLLIYCKGLGEGWGSCWLFPFCCHRKLEEHPHYY